MSIPPVINARPRVRIIARGRVRVHPVVVGHFTGPENVNIQNMPKRDAANMQPGGSAFVESDGQDTLRFEHLPISTALEATAKRFTRPVDIAHQLKSLPLAYVPYITDPASTFEQAKYDPAINTAQSGYEFTMPELESIWRMIEYWRAKING